MTVGVFIDRLEEFRQGVLQYRELSRSDQSLSHNGLGTLDPSELHSLRNTLWQQFTLLDEPVGAFSKGRYHFYLDSRGREDIYVHALSAEGQAKHIDLMLSDLEHMLAELEKRPRHLLLASHHQWPENSGANSEPSFGSLGHLGSSSSPASSEALHAALNTVACVIQQRVEQTEDQEELLAHVQAILDHPKITDLLPFSPSQRL
ncbi:MAG: hypothetical protein KC588_08335 [Nitrospira sp.]|nr:hypothetical protein [Nitrospira sp.]